MASDETPSPAEATLPRGSGVPFLLSFIAGLLILAWGLVVAGIGLTFTDLLRQFFPSGTGAEVLSAGLFIAVAVTGTALGALVLAGAFMLRRGKRMGGVVVIIGSALSLFAGGGLFVGMLLGLIGGAMGLMRPR